MVGLGMDYGLVYWLLQDFLLFRYHLPRGRMSLNWPEMAPVRSVCS